MSKTPTELPAVASQTRRLLIIGTSAFFVSSGVLTLVGCGGESASGAAGSGGGDILPAGAEAVGIRGTATLPEGVMFGKVTLVTGGSELILSQASFSAQVPGTVPTIACIIDTASGQVIMPCLIDPTSTNITLDSTNVAATLLFLCLGGWMLTTTRRDLWTSVLADPATAAFAAVVKARLDADPFAAIGGDALLVAGLTTALASQKITAPAAAPAEAEVSAESQKFVKSVKSVSAAQPSFPPLPSPFVYLLQQSGPHQNSTNGMAVGAHNYISAVSTPESLSYFQLINQDVIERTFVLAYVTGTDTNDIQIGTPIIAPPGSTSDLMTIPLRIPTDSAESVVLYTVAPTFDSPPYGLLDTQLVSLMGTLQSATWERTSVGLGADFIVSALGSTAASHDASALDSVIVNLKNVSANVSNGVAAADAGKNLPATVQGWLLSATGSPQELNGVISALRAIAPTLPTTISAQRLNQLRSLIRLGVGIGLQQLSSSYAATVSAYIWSPSTNVLSVYPHVINLERLTVRLFSANAQIPADGTPAKISVSLSILEHGLAADYLPTFASLFKFKYDFTGSSNVAMSDTKGNSGTSFVSTESSITLTASGTVAGKQTVTVEVFDIETGTDISIGTAGMTLDPSAVYSLDRTLYIIPIDGQTPVTVLRNNLADQSQWSGVDLSQLSFYWDSLRFVNGPLETPRNYQPLTAGTYPAGTGTPFDVFITDAAGTSLKLTGSYVVGYQLAISPVNPTVSTGSQVSVSVAAQDGSTLPTDVTYQWSVSGAGTFVGGNPLTTQSLIVAYTAPSTEETETLTVKMLDSQGIVIGVATTSIAVGAAAPAISPNTYTFDGPGESILLQTVNAGSIPANAQFTWTCQKGMLAANGGNGASSQSVTTGPDGVYFTPPLPPANGSKGTATVTLTITSQSGQVLLTTSATYNYGGTAFLIVTYPHAYSAYVQAPAMKLIGSPNIQSVSIWSIFAGDNSGGALAEFNLALPQGSTPSVGQSFTLDTSGGPHTVQPLTFSLTGDIDSNLASLYGDNLQINSGTLQIVSAIPNPSGSGNLLCFNFSLATTSGMVIGNGIVPQ